MNMLIKQTLNILTVFSTLLCVLLTNVVNAQQADVTSESLSQTVKIKARADHEFLLEADYYLGTEKNGGVIVLHDCKNDRRRYKNVADNLAKQGLSTLLIDFRGYGNSVEEGYSREQIQKDSPDIVSYQSSMALLTTYWQGDLLAAYQFLESKLTENKDIAIVASGCSGAYAVALAEKILLKSMVLITPKMTYSDKEKYKNLIDIPSYFVTSSRDQESYQIAQELFSWNGDQRSKIQTFKGDRYSHQLVNQKKYLLEDIAHWIKSTMSK